MNPGERNPQASDVALARIARRLRRGREAGFSLLELLLVIAIVSVVSAIALPRYAASQTHYRAESAAHRIAASLNYAAQHARRSSASTTVTLNVDANYLEIARVADLRDPDADFRVDFNREPLRATLVSADFGGEMKVTFNGFGLPNSGGTVLVRVGAWEKKVVLDAATGRASVP